MSSRHSCIAGSHLAPLSEIIGLEPEKEPWCAGYAPSEHRRCHARTNAYGRSVAMMLLNAGTKDLRAGRCIDPLLDDLAPHVLCRNNHQYQAENLAYRWKQEVRSYLDFQVATTTLSTRPTRRLSRVLDLETFEANIEEMAARLNESVRELQERVINLESARSTIVGLSPSHREGRRTNVAARSSSQRSASSRYTSSGRSGERTRRLSTESDDQLTATVSQAQPTWQELAEAVLRGSTVVNSRSDRSASSRNTSSEHSVHRTARRPSTGSTDQSRTAVSQPAQDQDIWQTTAEAALATREVVAAMRLRTPSGAGNQVSQSGTSRVCRREIKGECGICLCRMHGSQHDVDASEGEGEGKHSGDDDQGDNDHHGDDHDSDDQNDDDDDDDDEHRNAELVWCKARCGVNFHKHCIDQWLKKDGVPTCPACRSIWIR